MGVFVCFGNVGTIETRRREQMMSVTGWNTGSWISGRQVAF